MTHQTPATRGRCHGDTGRIQGQRSRDLPWTHCETKTSHRAHHRSHITEVTSRRSHHGGHITEGTSHREHHTGHITQGTSRRSHHGGHITEGTSHRAHHTGHITQGTINLHITDLNLAFFFLGALPSLLFSPFSVSSSAFTGSSLRDINLLLNIPSEPRLTFSACRLVSASELSSCQSWASFRVLNHVGRRCALTRVSPARNVALRSLPYDAGERS